ncbi:hypothetical protein C0Z18_11985 [Trinickia dabaoshanensis]|uniref:Uncharacterized protein n=1 Tax=Trinickia dabaoshanensis TaxID=564714 RepID=A0A2N7VSM2_9BURK|nr:hypothetical protein C0Z18_11985 [Trinickia dabaoshanensis]
MHRQRGTHVPRDCTLLPTRRAVSRALFSFGHRIGDDLRQAATALDPEKLTDAWRVRQPSAAARVDRRPSP